MSKHSLAPTTLALAAFALALTSISACSSDRDNNGGSIRRKNPDAEVEEQDTGTTTSNMDATTTNPNDDAGGSMVCNNPACDPNELQGAFPACQCLGSCRNGLTFNPVTRHCEGTPMNDGGVVNPPNDGGVVNPPGDSGVPVMTCTSAANCTVPSPACVTVDQTTGSLINCAGQTDCECVSSCSFDTPATGCQSGERCGFAGDMSNVTGRGLCIPANGGGAHAGSCLAMFDAQGNFQSHNCEVGNFCFGAASDNPTGTCAQLCNPANNAPCAAFGAGYHCWNFDDPTSTVGFCRHQITATDIGQSCASAATCDGNLCSPVFVNSCSADCTNSVIEQCPAGSTCVGLTSGDALCAKDCVPGTAGDSTCSGLNNMTICEALGDTMNPLDICIPKCTADADCTPQTCNLTSGHCQ